LRRMAPSPFRYAATFVATPLARQPQVNGKQVGFYGNYIDMQCPDPIRFS
jgi:hypothetical protein